MPHRADQLRADALGIWQAGVDAVRSDRLVETQVRVEGEQLWIGEESVALSDVRRIVVVGAGKAGAGMAQGLEAALGPRVLAEKQVSGWVNVPADCVRPLQCIHLHAARPPGVNEPTPEAVAGTEQILKLVSRLDERDLCLVLLSGGGSALLPAPPPEVPLAEKVALTRHLSAAGANIQELNTVRKQLSRVKGGGLARACRAGQMVTLVISDVLGDPLDVIASGPTVLDRSTPAQALAILKRLVPDHAAVAPAATQYLQMRASAGEPPAPATCRVRHVILANNATAVEAAGHEAERRGYAFALSAAATLEGPAEEVGQHLAQMAQHMRTHGPLDCLITGGEPTVQLAPPPLRGKGGRNQQLVLAALIALGLEGCHRIALLSGGTDGEDGPTDAAGAVIDEPLAQRCRALALDPRDYLRRNDAYTFFERLGGLIKTGPTHTNVCDLRVVVVQRA
jgi:hydroxypyruvate reductase